jgi:CelD/BcsL family acetyltransferase involved in cellulose biosynthesis
VASTGSDHAPRIALEDTASAIASARRAVLAGRYAINAFAVEWRWLSDMLPLADAWRDLAARALEPNVFYEPAFALAAAAVFGNDVGAVLVWSGTQPRQLLGFFPARVEERHYGIRLPILTAWTHPYGPLGAPLVDREAVEPVIAAWLAHVASDPALPGLLLLPLIAEDGAFATALARSLERAQMPWSDFGRHSRALLVPGDDRAHYLERAVSPHRYRELRRTGRRLADQGALLFTTATTPASVATDVEDFFALETAGWKGLAGTAAASSLELHGFFKTAVAQLAAEGKAQVDRLLLDGRAIAAAVTLTSGTTAWYWKIAYDQAYARYAPGILLSAALTEQLAENQAITRADSCAAPGPSMLDLLWHERLHLCDRMIAVRPTAQFTVACKLETLRRAAIGTAKALRARLRRR